MAIVTISTIIHQNSYHYTVTTSKIGLLINQAAGKFLHNNIIIKIKYEFGAFVTAFDSQFYYLAKTRVKFKLYANGLQTKGTDFHVFKVL